MLEESIINALHKRLPFSSYFDIWIEVEMKLYLTYTPKVT